MRRVTARGRTLLVVAAVGGLGACADAGAAPAGQDAEQVRLSLQQTYEQTWGDPRTRHAAEVLAYVGSQERLAECLAARGAGLEPAPFVDATSPRPGPLSWYDPLLPVDGEGDLMVPVDAPPAEVTPARTWPGRPPTPDDTGACLQPPPEVPAVAPDLDDELYGLVTDALGTDAEVEGYQECLGDNGFEAADRDDLVDLVLTERGADGRPGPRERDAVVADAACRADAHAAAMAALDEPLATFRSEHAEELAAAGRAAQDLQQRARAAADEMGLAVTWW